MSEHRDRESSHGAHSAANPGTLEPIGSHADHCSRGSHPAHCGSLLPFVAIGTDGAFFVFHRRLLHSWNVIHRSRHGHRIAVGEDKGRKAEAQLGPPLNSNVPFYLGNFALYIGSRRDDDHIIHHHWKCCPEINAVPRTRRLCGNRMNKRQHYLRSCWNGHQLGVGAR